MPVRNTAGLGLSLRSWLTLSINNKDGVQASINGTVLSLKVPSISLKHGVKIGKKLMLLSLASWD
jgi:hypothetical protein